MNLLCKDHQKYIAFVDEGQDVQQGHRAKCENCRMSETVHHIDSVQPKIDEKLRIAESKFNDQISEFEKLSNPLEQVLTNYFDEFNSTIQLIKQEVRHIKKQIRDNFSIAPKPMESQNLSDFEQILHKVFSNSIDQFNLQSTYSQLIKAIQTLIKLQICYSQKITKCFMQLQNDMTNYEHQYSFNVKGSQVCTAMCMGSDSDGQLVAIALGNVLKTYEFSFQKNKAIEKQCLNHFNHNIGCVVFSEDYKYLIVGGTFDAKMNIYIESQTKKQYELKSQIIYKEPIFSIIFTQNNEDLISASGNDLYCLSNENIQQIFEYKQLQEDANPYQLNHSHSNTVYQLSYYTTKQKQKFISCSYDKSIFIWQKEGDQWNVLNRIRLQNSAYRCCFIGQDNIVIQENSSRELTFYDNVSDKRKCKQNTNKQCKFNDLNVDLSHNFPIIYLEQLKLLIVKHNKKIVFFKQRKSDQFYKEDEKDGEMGTVSNDGQIFLRWDKINQKVEIYKQSLKFEVNKGEFEAKFFDSKFKLLEDSKIQSETFQNFLITSRKEENKQEEEKVILDDKHLKASNHIQQEINQNNLNQDRNSYDDMGPLDMNDSDSPILVQFND